MTPAVETALLNNLRINPQHQKICLPDTKGNWRSAVYATNSDIIATTGIYNANIWLLLYSLPIHLTQ
jgi:hypothetical protein